LKIKKGHLGLSAILVDNEEKKALGGHQVPLLVDHEDKKNLVANKCPKIPQKGKKHTWWPQGCLQLMKRKQKTWWPSGV
jgi:hypothetical protein